jgi:hypothetical protein
MTTLKGATYFQNQPWRGWKLFHVWITQKSFVTALRSLEEKGSGFKGSLSPEDYQLLSCHLNAEIKFGSGPSDLGWSMRHERVALVKEAEGGPGK